MKIICSRSDLVAGVQIVSKAVPTNTTMSILECILIEVNDDSIKFTANDTELGIETYVEGQILETGKVALEAKMFLDVVRKLPEGDVTIETDDAYTATITCMKAKMAIAGKSGDDFTNLPKVEKEESIVISQFTLKELIRQTIFSVGFGSTNKIMTGLDIIIKNDQLKITSLDGHRISVRKVQLKDIYSEKEVIIPGKTLNEISKILSGDTESEVIIYITNNHVLFEFDNTTVVSRLIEGNYFNVDKMMSSEYETKITINKKDLYDCIDRSMLFSKEGNKKPIVVTVSEDTLKLEVNSPLGSMDEDIEISKQGKDIRIGFNPKFMLDALKVIDEESIDVYFVNPKAPCYIKDENEKFIYMILPVNLS
ncbi:MAG: DNA polymerase III subunit beta [Lachnospiraceae bacterium]|nr:DNA polymerase III subunit beta [Lachnospiraceae bacterium]MBQ8262804.1 DNA polymerase III subunit beta [Lachnospiraceae bacterium]